MGAAVAGPGPLGRGAGQGDRLPGHGRFALGAAPGHVFNHMAVPVPGGEILQGMHAGRVFLQGLFDDA